jgi:hypothetical protein
MQLPLGIQAKELILFLAGAVAALAISFVFYRLGREKKRITYTAEVRNLVFRDKQSPGNLKITYDGREIKSLTRLTIYVWNSGTVPIKREDLVTRNSPMFRFAEGLVPLQGTVVYQSRDANEVAVSRETAAISFAYLNPVDGFVFDVFAEENDEAKGAGALGKEVEITGEIVGIIKPPIRIDYEYSRGWRFALGSLASGVIMIIFSLSFLSPVYDKGELTWSLGVVMNLLFFGALATIAVVSLVIGAKALAAHKIPYRLYRKGEEPETFLARFAARLR